MRNTNCAGDDERKSGVKAWEEVRSKKIHVLCVCVYIVIDLLPFSQTLTN